MARISRKNFIRYMRYSALYNEVFSKLFRINYDAKISDSFEGYQFRDRG